MSGYRRGAVLGLTIAEVFMLLLFLVLLAALVFITQWNEEKQRYEDKLSVLRRKALGRMWMTPEEIETLQGRVDTAERQRKEYQDIAEKERLKQEEATRTAEDREMESKNLQAKLRQADETLKQVKKEAEQERESAQEIRDRMEGQRQVAAAAEEARKMLEQAREEGRNTRNALDMLRRKGENPPCWYATVPAGEGKTREKPYYILNVAVRDDGLVMVRSPVPAGGAKDDGGRLYEEEAKDLGLDELPYGRVLTDRTFIEHMEPLFDLGKERKVRRYPCIFSVRVWDKTSPGAKDRWKQAHDRVIEGLFGTYEVRDDPWPGVN